MIELILLDVDGVLTDGYITYDSEGKEIKSFNVKDGLGLKLARMAGIKTAIISGRNSKVTEIRAKELKIDYVFQSVDDKTEIFLNLIKDLNIKKENTAFIGDDINDLKLLKTVGLSAAVYNAVDEVKNNVDIVLSYCGGKGAVREFIEIILKRNGQWKNIINTFT